MTVFDEFRLAVDELADDEQAQRASLNFALGVLLGMKLPGAAAAVALTWKRAYPGDPPMGFARIEREPEADEWLI